MSQETLTRLRDRHSTVDIGSIQIHGTQLLLVSSNQSDSWRRIPGTDSAARFQPAESCAGNETSFSLCFRP